MGHLVVNPIEVVDSEEEEQLQGEEVALMEVPTGRSWGTSIEILVVQQVLFHMTVVMTLELDVVEVVLGGCLEAVVKLVDLMNHPLKLGHQMNRLVDLYPLMKLLSMDHPYQWGVLHQGLVVVILI